MPFVLKEIPAIKGLKIQTFFRKHTDYSLATAQRNITKGRVFDGGGIAYKMSEIIRDNFVKMATFEGKTRGLKPLFETNDFAIFDKPSGLMVHPTSRTTAYTLLDEVRYHFGDEANLVHRIDLETSGIILASKDKITDIALKTMFEEKLYQKTYLALVRGKIKDNITIDSPITKDFESCIGVKMKIDLQKGRESLTYIRPINYDKKYDYTLVEAKPITGRQHQIRIHLHSIGHTIVGDPIYGVDEVLADKYLCKKLDEKTRFEITGANRLMLHALALEFEYKNRKYHIISKQKFNKTF
jgi:23S rRNA pseudouridine1911/1915/1917 synthase